jgi:hypothetical protein
MVQFIKGLDLGEDFHAEIVRPLLLTQFPTLKYSAALIGNGSEILGFDTEMSVDHDWGPRMILFIENIDHKNDISEMLANNLPSTFKSFPTSFNICETDGVQVPDHSNTGGRINHRVKVITIKDYFLEYLNYDVTEETTISALDWLTFPQQKLRAIIEGRVFHDDLNLRAVRSRFTYYPQNVWLLQLAGVWTRIEEEEHLFGRCGSVDDEVGSAIVAGRLVRHLMSLCFLLEGKYAPYLKWFGSAFKQLHISNELQPILMNILNCGNSGLFDTENNRSGDGDHKQSMWQRRQVFVIQAFECVARHHKTLNITPNHDTPVTVTQFHNRPFRVISMGVFSTAVKETLLTNITENHTKPHDLLTSDDRALLNLICGDLASYPLTVSDNLTLLGGIDNFGDNCSLLEQSTYRLVVRELYA